MVREPNSRVKRADRTSMTRKREAEVQGQKQIRCSRRQRGRETAWIEGVGLDAAKQHIPRCPPHSLYLAQPACSAHSVARSERLEQATTARWPIRNAVGRRLGGAGSRYRRRHLGRLLSVGALVRFSQQSSAEPYEGSGGSRQGAGGKGV